MEVYDRAVRTLPEPERLAVYELYLAKASEFFGIGKACPLGPGPGRDGLHAQSVHICSESWCLHTFMVTRFRLRFWCCNEVSICRQGCCALLVILLPRLHRCVRFMRQQ